jgi:hypothetical protein
MGAYVRQVAAKVIVCKCPEVVPMVTICHYLDLYENSSFPSGKIQIYFNFNIDFWK